MKVVVLHRYPPKQVIGTNASFLYFLEEMSRQGHEVYYVTYHDKSESELPKIKNLKFIFLPFTFERGNNFDKIIKTWLWIFVVPFYVLSLQHRHSVDLVYCDDSVPLYGFFSKIISPRSKVVLRLGDLQTGYSLSDKSPILFAISQGIEALMWKVVDGLVAISSTFKDYITTQGIDESKIKVVEESINLDEKLAESPKKNKEVVFVFHGALLKCKGLTCLLKAFSKVCKKYKNTKLVIAGGGDQDELLKKMVQEMKIKGVEFTGWYDHQKLSKIMAQADIGIAMRSSNMANNFVVTTCLLENWKYSKPVIAPRLDSMKKIITEGDNGMLFMPNDSNDLAKKMIFLLERKNLWKKLGEKGYDTAKGLFEYKQIARKMVKTITEI